METKGAPTEDLSSGGFLSKFLSDLVDSPVNLALLGVCGYLLYRVLKGRRPDDAPYVPDESLPPLPKRDMTVEEIRPYDGKQPDGRILMAVNGKVFDVTRGKKFYGPGLSEMWNLIKSKKLLQCHFRNAQYLKGRD